MSILGDQNSTDQKATAPSSTQSEREYYDIWKEERLAYLEPAAMAFRGGRLAGSLPWVFMAGYQAALHHNFSTLPKTGWVAFAASEDKSDPDNNPPSVLTIDESDGTQAILSGTKSWIAASASVDHLLVLAREDDSENKRKHCVLIERDTEGVSISQRKAPKFLSEMSQGRASFDNVKVDTSLNFDEDQAREFLNAEPPFVMLASTGFLLSQLGEKFPDLKDGLLDIATGLSALCQAGSWTAKRLAYLDRKLQASLEAFVEVVDCDALPNWDADKMLLSMYSKRLQEKAG